MPGMSDTPKSARRWFQISLRTLLLLVTLVSAAFGWLGFKFRQAKRQRDAVHAIQKLGGCATLTDAIGTSPGPVWLRRWMDDDFFANTTMVLWSGPQVTDDTIIHLGTMPKLAMLELDKTRVTDAGLVHLGQLRHLVTLKLSRMPITDAGLVHLRQLTELQELTIDGTQISKQGCQQLKMRLPNTEIDSDVLWEEEPKP
jgi:hypothetical protein